MPLRIQPGLSVLINDVMDLNPHVNLLPGATSYYSAFPAADGKVGIYTRWGGNDGAEQAITGVTRGIAPRSKTWTRAVEILQGRYREFNPPGVGITSVLIVRDNDDDGDKTVVSDASAASAAAIDAGNFAGLMKLLDVLPADLIEEAYRRRPSPVAGTAATNGQETTFTPTQSPVTITTNPSSGISSTDAATPTQAAFSAVRSPSNVPCGVKSLVTTSNRADAPAAPKSSSTSSGSAPRSNSLLGYAPPNSNPQTPVKTHASSSMSYQMGTNPKALIDSPLRGAGIAPFMAPKECYVVGRWTKMVLEFIQCANDVIPIVETHLPRFCHDEDDVEFQAVLGNAFTIELSHLVIHLLKLDAFLKSLGTAA